jgi:hypothetical protein
MIAAAGGCRLKRILACAIATLFVAIRAFAADLYGVTGESTAVLDPETLYEIDPTDGSPTLVLGLGNGTNGETIGFDPQDGLLRHASGSGAGGDHFWESIDVSVPSVTSSTQVTGASSSELTALAWSPFTNRFLAADRSSQFLAITPAGSATLLGTTPVQRLKGLAFRATQLYACNSQGNQLYRLDPATGASLGSVTMTIDGNVMEGCNGLTVDPTTGVMWAVIRSAVVNDRLLSTVNPFTGAATSVAAIDQFAGIVFLEEPPLSAGLGLGCAALLTLAALATQPGTQRRAAARLAPRSRVPSAT